MRWRGSWLPLALAIGALLIITTGGYVRIHDAGESCPDWPLCFGQLHPFVSEVDQATWYAEHPDEVDSRGDAHRYAAFEMSTEWFHRLLVGAIALPLLAAWFIAFRRQDTLGPTVHRLGLAAGTLLILQASAGWLTVKLDNVPYSVGLHLVLSLTFTTLLLAMWLAWAGREEAGRPRWASLSDETAARVARPAVWSATVALLLLFVGALLATGGHNGACEVGWSGWPGCRGVPFTFDGDAGALLQQLHRTLALGVGVALFAAWRHVRQSTEGSPDATGVTTLLLAALVLWAANGLVGGLYVLLATDGFPQSLSLTHLVLGSLAFLSLVLVALAARPLAGSDPAAGSLEAE